MLTSELGAEDPADGYVSDYLAWADEHNLGALFWVWADHPADPMALIADERGAPDAVRPHRPGLADRHQPDRSA